MSQRLVVGLTGIFGSGKSTVGQIFKKLGARKVIDCDQLVREAFRPRHPIERKIKALFDIEGHIDRNVIARKVFSNPRKRKHLEAIVHPYVYGRISSELKEVRRGVVVLEVPLLFETGFDRICDVTITVLAGEHNVRKRLCSKGMSSSEVHVRLRAQLPEREKKHRADLYIQNFGSKNVLVKKTKLAWRKLVSILNKN